MKIISTSLKSIVLLLVFSSSFAEILVFKNCTNKDFSFEKNEYKTIIKGDHKLNRIPDLSHPILAWHPNGNVLAIFEEKKGDVVLNLYDIKNKQKNIKNLMGFIYKFLRN